LATDPDETARAAELRTVRAVAAGDETAFARLVGEHGPALLRFAQSVLGDPAEAEDVVQETFVRLWKHAGAWQPQARLRTWLHTLCYHRSVDRLRARRPSLDPTILDEVPDSGLAPDAALIRAEEAASLGKALGALSHRQRTAVALFHFQELSQAECAAIMDLSQDAFESLLARARRQLRAALADDEDGSEGSHG
jgi:RNA polymerase sigma-70 factor (ECF subfamily)